MSLVVTKDQEILAGTVAGWGVRCGLRAAARAEVDIPPGERPRELPQWWPQAVDLGLPGLAVPESLGGAGAGVEELAVALAELGRQVAPGPLAPSAAAGLVLAAARNLAASRDGLDVLVSGVAAGAVVAAVALDGQAEAARTAAGWRVSGEAGLVIGARQANWLLVRARTPEGPRWLAAEMTGQVTVSPVQSLDVTRPMDRVSLSDALVRERHVLAGVADDLVRELYVTTAAAEAAGIARWAVETATAYAKVRVQFGRPIGAFQAIKHLCADMLARSEMAAAAAWDAAAAATAYLREADDEARRQLSVAACAAGAVALEDAVSNSKDCIQVLGGIGMTWEHDAHLSLRRAMTLRATCGGTSRWRARVADLGRAGLRRQWSVSLADASPDTRRTVRAVLGRLPQDPRQRRVALADAGLIAPQWRRPYGLGASPAEQLVITEELGRAGIELPDLVVGNWAVPTIIEFGSDAQRDRFARPTLRGEIAWCQLFSEPGAGSDLASLRTRAVRVDGGWSLAGQKVWTSMARDADWAICLARTSPGVPNHKGITYFLVDMKTPGIDVRPLREITGDAIFNEVFLDDVFVPDDMVVGDVDGGWRLARATLSSERVAIATGSRLGHGLDELLAETRPEPVLDDQLGELIARGQVARALGQQITLRQVQGLEPGAAASIRKLVTSPLNQDATELAVTAMGTAGADLTDPKAAAQAHAFMLTRSGTIAGGSSQVLRNIIAERLLGLPRD
jgi:alkylation response protein AidB-like acyl-CoA dehydrogenase